MVSPDYAQLANAATLRGASVVSVPLQRAVIRPTLRSYQHSFSGSRGRKSLALPLTSPSKPISIRCVDPSKNLLTPHRPIAVMTAEADSTTGLKMRNAVTSRKPAGCTRDCVGHPLSGR